MKLSKEPGAIGVFDSGYGGLTILKEIRELLPQYDYIYLGDNARAPYGSRSFDLIYKFTLEAVKHLFEQGCHLVILACNTASAKALRSIQQRDLPLIDSSRRVLGVIRPTVEQVKEFTKTNHIGIVATSGTIQSQSYPLEIAKLFPDIKVSGQACPMWVPLVENNEFNKPGADYFVIQGIEQLLQQDANIDTILLGCTHYPLLEKKIREYTPQPIKVVAQGKYVAKSLENYLERHPEMDAKCSKGATCKFLTTESEDKFRESAAIFLEKEIDAQRVQLS